VIGNGWTDFRDLITRHATEAAHECTSVVVGKELGAEGRLYLAQTWDMSASAGPYMVLVRRRPKDAPATLSLTTAGCLSLIGMNEAGIAIGNTNLVPYDARPGVHYLALIHEALRQRALAAAVERITGAQRLSGHYFYLGGPDGEFRGLETCGTRHLPVGLQGGFYVHTNHYRDRELAEQVGEVTPSANSVGRQERMETLARGLTAGATATEISQLLQNHDGEHVICRHAQRPTDAATLGAAVMCPESREMLVGVGNPCISEFRAFSV
ncbi:MAG: C45 family peptidase, partial [Armatimonadia bacterium]